MYPGILKESRMESPDSDVSDAPEFLKELKEHRKQNIIPPIGIAEPRLVEAFKENMENEDAIRQAVEDEEAYKRETPWETAERQTGAHLLRAGEGLFTGIQGFLKLLSEPDVEINEKGEPEFEQLPTIEPREITKKLTGKKYEPKSGFEESSQEYANDVGILAATPISALNTLLTPLLGVGAKELTKASGGGEDAQAIAKLTTMGIASIAGMGNAPRIARQAYNDAVNMIPRGLSFASRPTELAFQQIRNRPWYRTGRTAAKGPAMDEMQRIENLIQNGRMNGQEAMQLRRDINERRRAMGGFLEQIRGTDTRRALEYLDEVDQALLSSMENYGTRVNPQWWRQYNLANEAYRVTARSQQLSTFITKNAKPLQSTTAKMLLHSGLPLIGTQLPGLAAAAVPIMAGAKGIQIMNRMIQSPVLRNHYARVMAASAAGNANLVKSEVEKFDKAAQKIEAKNNREEQ